MLGTVLLVSGFAARFVEWFVVSACGIAALLIGMVIDTITD